MADQSANSTSTSSSLSLPAPIPPTKSTSTVSPEGNPTSTSLSKLDASTGQSVSLDELGPMVVNSDGTLSRIANWPQMTEPERERTLRVLSARNKLRLANEVKKQQGSEGASEQGEELLSAAQ